MLTFFWFNDIKYKYEEKFWYGTNEFFRPDFTLTLENKKIYHEHFGMVNDEKKRTSNTDDFNDNKVNKYVKELNMKIKTMQEKGEVLYYTYGAYADIKKQYPNDEGEEYYQATIKRIKEEIKKKYF